MANTTTTATASAGTSATDKAEARRRLLESLKGGFWEFLHLIFDKNKHQILSAAETEYDEQLITDLVMCNKRALGHILAALVSSYDYIYYGKIHNTINLLEDYHRLINCLMKEECYYAKTGNFIFGNTKVSDDLLNQCIKTYLSCNKKFGYEELRTYLLELQEHRKKKSKNCTAFIEMDINEVFDKILNRNKNYDYKKCSE